MNEQVLNAWWRSPLKSKLFKDNLYFCPNNELLDAYDCVRDLAPIQKGWKSKMRIMIQEMGRRGVSFTF